MRPPDQVLRDVVDGYVTREAAEREYGVVIDPQALVIDADATDKLRKGLAHDTTT
jgi:N-methylhydantoinase B/oxoprolinase/acetone carboxylase alpha subunit